MPENNTAINGPTPVGTSASKPKIRIVVADDHPIFRDGLCKLLALEDDFEVVAQAQDGRQVLEILQQQEPDILLLDLKMPGLDGLGTLQRLQAARNKTRVIVLTASDDKNEFVQAMKLGTSGIVLKQTRHGTADQEHPQGACRRNLAGFPHHRRGDPAVRGGATSSPPSAAADPGSAAARTRALARSASANAKSWPWWRRASRIRKWPRRCSSASRR